jgi:hypothetical protein
MRPTRLITCLTIVGTLVAFGAVPASAKGVSVSATPNTKLADGQQISVSGAGFAPQAFVAVVECPTTTVSPSACDLNTLNFANADDNGAFSDLPFTVSRVLSDGTDCALNGGCYVGVQDANNGGPTAAALIKFHPSIPPFVITARVDKSDRVNEKGVATITGTVKCSGGSDADVFVEIDLRQVVDRAIFTSYAEADVSCPMNSTVPYRVTVRPQNGLFGPGAASVHIFASSGSHGTTHKVAITLHH